MNGDSTTPTNNQIPVGEGIDALQRKGYDSNRIVEIMSYVGYNPADVSNEFIRRHEEERQAFLQEKERRDELFRQQREAYDGLKKKDSPSVLSGESLDSDPQSLGSQESIADPRLFQIRQNDELAMNGVMNSRLGNNLVRAVNFNDPKAITKALQEAQRNNLLPEFSIEEEYDQETLAKIQEAGNEMIGFGKNSYQLALSKANEMNKSLGIDLEYDINSESDFGLFLRESAERAERDEREFDQKTEEFIRQIPGMRDEEVGYGSLLLGDLSISNMVSGMAAFQADVYGEGLGMRNLYGDSFTSQYYQDKIKETNQINSEKERVFYEGLGVSEEAYSKGITERTMAAWNGDISIGDYLATTSLETGRVMADGLKSIAEMAVNPAVMAVDVFGESYGNTRAYSPHMSISEAAFTSAARATAEVGMAALLLKMKVGADYAVQGLRSGSRKAAIESAKKEMSGEVVEGLSKRILKGTAAEGLEEGVVAVADWTIDAVDNIMMGRNVRDLNFHEVADAALAGMAGGFGPISVTSLASHRGHTRFMAQRSVVMEKMARLRKRYESETDPVRKQQLEKELVESMAAAKVITNEEAKLYDDFSPEEKGALIKYNQEIARSQEILKSGKHWTGDPVTQEERQAIEERLEENLNKKAELEQAVEKRQAEEETSREVETPPTVEDAGEQKSPAKTRKVEESEKKSHDNVPEATDAAPEGQQQQAVQLSLFDEVTEPGTVAEPEAEAETEAETQVEEEVTEKPVEQETEDVFEVNVAEGQMVDLKDTEVVGDGAGQIPIAVASSINKMTKAFGGVLNKLGTKVKFHKTDESFGTISPEMKAQMKVLQDKKGAIYGYYDKDTNTIHLNNNTEAIDAFEEFGHAVLEGVIGKDAEARQRLYGEMEKIAKGKTKGAKAVKAVLEETKKFYEGRPDATLQEESIISVLVRYANNPDQFLSVKDKIRAAFNRVFKGIGVKGNVIKGDEGLFDLADKFRRAAQGQETTVEPEPATATAEETQEEVQEEPQQEAQPDVAPKRPTETQEEFDARIAKAADAMLGSFEGVVTPKEDVLEQGAESIDMFQGRLSVRQKKNFDYLKDTEIFYTNYPSLGPGQSPLTSSRYTTYSAQKSVKVNDYFHFRNWYNKQTGNQRADRIANMYFIKDGKKYKVNPPRPKVDRDGNPVYMEVPLTYNQQKRKEAFDRSDQRKEVRRQARDIRDESRKLFRELPWNGYVNALQFEPPGPERMERTADQDYRIAVIAKKNIEAALEMGLTKEDIEKRIDDSGRSRAYAPLNRVQDSDLVNATGMVPFDDAEAGDTVGLFAIRYKKEDLGDPDYVMPENQMKDFQEGNLEDYRGLFSPTSGYDKTMPDTEKGITSGPRAVMDLDDADLEELKEGESVVSTHVNLAMARKRMERYRAQAQAIFDKANNIRFKDEEKRARSRMNKADSAIAMSGKFGSLFAPLTYKATKGNPDVFVAVMRGLIARSRDKNVGISGPTIYDKFTSAAKAKVRTMIRMAENDGFEGLSEETARLFSSSDFVLPVTTQKQFEEIVDVLINYHTKMADQFEARKPFLGKDVMGEYFSHEAFEMGRDVPTSGTIDQQIAEYFNDPALKAQKAATLFGGKRFTYEIDQDILKNYGQVVLKNMRVKNLSGYGFTGAIIVDGDSTSLEVFKEQYTLDKIDPDFIGGDISGKAKDTKRKKEFEGASDPYSKAEALNRYSQYEVNAEVQDVNGKASIRDVRGLKSVRTDQGTWQVSDLTAFQTWRNKWIKRLQDKYVDIFKLQEDVEAARGVRDQSQDFKMAEELMYGKAAEDLRKLDDKQKDLVEAMKEGGVSVQEVSDYLYALHAPERNALIEERTEGKEESGSGMTNEEARSIIDSIPSDKRSTLDAIVKMVRDIQQDTRDTMVEFGLESQEAIDAFESQFDSYVPLSGIAVDEESSVTSSYPTGGAGLSVFGPTTKRAEGRKSQAENILAQVIAQNASVHIKARTNEALQSLYELVKENPNDKVWRIVDGSKATSQDPHSVSVRVDGEQKFIRFKDASYAETLRNMNLPATSVFVRMLRAPSNWLRRSFTTLNPEFMISNFSRDIQSAIFNAAAEADIPGGIIEGDAIVADMIRKVPATLKALVKAETPEALSKFLKENPEIERYYNDFRDDGGKTGWSYAKPLADIAAALESETSDKTRMQTLLGNAEAFARTIEGVNDAFENSIRLSAYIAAREKGVSREKAAQLAKNITVNFNKSGEYGQLLNSVYLFFNASVQGTARLGRSLLTLKEPTYPDGTKRAFKDRMNNAQKMAAALTVFNGMLTMLSLAMSGEDEDGELYYNKIPDYIKERNLIIMRPNGKDYYKVPLPYGFSLFANLGSSAVEVGAGHKEIDTAMMQLTSSFINSFSPISFGQSSDLFTKAGKSAVPTVFKPIVDIMTNETYFGGPVFKENLPYGLQQPESSMSFRSPESVQQFFRWMNEATGGSVEVKGDLDFNPDKMWYLFEYFIGGAGKFVTRTGEAVRGLAAKASDNEVKIEANDLPFLRILYGEPSKYMDVEDYRARRQKIMELKAEMKRARRKDDPDRYKGVYALSEVLKIYDKQLSNLRKQRRNALEIQDYTERMKRMQELADKERSIVMKFNKRYEQTRKD
mgnify:CR=1 FL=1|jgi:hypothetical protein|tara:strand:- start:5871 stop:13727 length:7857 start_codon:yes stop_codon:yes gene_type:complete